MTSAHAITLENVSKHYGSVRAIDDVSLAVAPGEFITLLGPSGSGKTTVLMAIAGFVTPTRGTIRLDGMPITEKPPESRNFGVVFQGYALFPHMSVAENVAYPLRVRRTAKAEISRRVKAALDLVQLGPLADRMPPQLSGGQQQRVALARALVFQPQVLLLDEPMSALDKKLRAELQLELRDLHRRLGATFINVTHDQEEAIIMSDRIAIMRDGKVIQLGAPKELYERPATRFVADFLGKSNFLSHRHPGAAPPQGRPRQRHDAIRHERDPLRRRERGLCGDLRSAFGADTGRRRLDAHASHQQYRSDARGRRRGDGDLVAGRDGAGAGGLSRY